MSSIKCLIGLIFLVGLCAMLAWLELKLVLQFGNELAFAGALVLVALLAALWQAPEGYEDAAGFRIEARRGRPNHGYHGESTQPTRSLTLDVARLFSSS